MPLPKIDRPVFKITIPSTKQVTQFRSFLVKEEKILLMARESEDVGEILRALRQVINNCAVDELDIEALTTFDIEYLFLKLRARSVNNIAKISFMDNETEEMMEWEIDLEEIEVQFPENPVTKIKVSDDVGIILKYPSAAIAEQLDQFQSFTNLMMFFIINCIKEIYDSENVYDPAMYSEEELVEFIDSFDIKAFEQIQEFFNSLPRLYYKIQYTNKNGNEVVYELTSLKDFFTLG